MVELVLMPIHFAIPASMNPSELQLTLALAIVKSKPSNTTIRDHVIGMRGCLMAGRRNSTAPTDDKHLDGASFWRKAYEKSEAAQTALKDEIYELQQKNEALLLKVKPGDVPAILPSTAKRKSNTNDTLLQPARPQKRSKTMCMGKGSGNSWSGYSLSYDLGDLTLPKSVTASLMRRIHTLQTLLRKKTALGSLAVHVVELCKDFEKAIVLAMEMIVKPRGGVKEKGRRPPQPALRETLLGLERCYPAILQSLSTGSKTDTESENTGLMVYHIVQLFMVIMQQMHQYTLNKAERLSNSKKPTGKSKSRATATAENSSARLTKEDQKTLECFSRCVTAMLLSLDPKKPGHDNLMEGLVFIILEKVGEILGRLVFKQILSDPEADAGSIPSCLTRQCDPHNADQAAVWSSKYLVRILDRAMAFVNQHLPTLTTSNRPETSAGEPQSLDLLERARTRLQNTLLKGIFGATDPMFNDSLTLPTQPTYPQAGTESLEGVEEDPKEWFSQEVWRILGWNSLLCTF